jgi:anti-anti-sigma regulatory factor
VVTVQCYQQQQRMVSVSGELTGSAAAELSQPLAHELSVASGGLVIDLSNVTAIDAACTDVLVLASRLASKSTTRLSLVVAPGVVDDTLKLFD